MVMSGIVSHDNSLPFSNRDHFFMSSIRPLPAQVAAQIKSSISITSLNGVILELLKNGLDAESSKIDIDVDYGRGSCMVIDNGLGILPADFTEEGGLGKLYYSSKYGNKVVAHGSHGSFLASLAALSIMSITSRHHQYHSQNTISINRSKIIGRHIPAVSQQSALGVCHGTRVIVRDLFGNMPVRVKQRVAASSESQGYKKHWEEIRRGVTSLILAWPYSVNVTVRDITSGQRLQLRGSLKLGSQQVSRIDSDLRTHIVNILSQGNFIQPQEKLSWVSTTASTSQLSMHGFISLQPAPNKIVQFISLGISPLNSGNGQNILYEDINKIFAESSFGVEVDKEELNEEEKERRSKDRRYKIDGFTNQQLKGRGKGVDRWPMFYIRIDIADTIAPQSRFPMFLDDSQGMLTSISELLQLMFLEFLRTYHFRPKGRRFLKSTDQQIRSKKISDISTNFTIDEANSNLTQPLSRSQSSDQSSRKNRSNSKLQNKFLTDSPFSSCSRIKSGRHAPSSNLSSNAVVGYEAIQNPLNYSAISTTNPAVRSQDLSESNEPNVSGDQEPGGSYSISLTIAKSGQVIRRPFEDVSHQINSTQCSTSKTILVPAKLSIETEAELIVWIDPGSSRQYLMNTRTGLTSYAQENALRSSSQNFFTEAQRARLNSCPKSNAERSDWIKSILKGWKNPVFRPAEISIPQIPTDVRDLESLQILHGHRYHCSRSDIDRAFRASTAGYPGRLSKNTLRRADVLCQLDKKFILIKLTCATSSPELSPERAEGDIVVVDQHAADERCRIEELLSSLLGPSGVLSTTLTKPMTFKISSREIELLEIHSRFFASWGIIYQLSTSAFDKDQRLNERIIVTALPTGIFERCKLEPKLVIGLIRSEAWKCEERKSMQRRNNSEAAEAHDLKNYPWLRKLHDCPQGILDLLNSRACRSAIMFNDELSRNQCKALVARLAECAFPFQCAHGRPSMVPLVSFGAMQNDAVLQTATKRDNFAVEFKKWKIQFAPGGA